MARRNKQSLGNDLIEMTARLPWWAGVGLALLSYVIFHALASRPVPAMSQPGQLGVAVSSTWSALWRGRRSSLRRFFS